jgi:hypothetical protein
MRSRLLVACVLFANLLVALVWLMRNPTRTEVVEADPSDRVEDVASEPVNLAPSAPVTTVREEVPEQVQFEAGPEPIAELEPIVEKGPPATLHVLDAVYRTELTDVIVLEGRPRSLQTWTMRSKAARNLGCSNCPGMPSETLISAGPSSRQSSPSTAAISSMALRPATLSIWAMTMFCSLPCWMNDSIGASI